MVATQPTTTSITKRTGLSIELFATNLHNPSHMEWTPQGRLLVSEHTAGRVMDITDGGDMRDAKPYAYGLQGPSAILPIDDHLLVAETWGGRVSDISAGGDVSDGERFATELSTPYSLSAIKREGEALRIFVSERFKLFKGQVTEITAGGGRSGFLPFVTDVPVRPGKPGKTPLESWPDDWEHFASAGCENAPWTTDVAGDLFFEVGHIGQIVRAPENGGVYADLEERGYVIAWGLERIGGMKAHPHDGRVYAVEPDRGAVVAIDPSTPRHYCFDPPVAQGFFQPTCVRFSDDGETMYVCSSGDGVIWKVTNFLRV